MQQEAFGDNAMSQNKTFLWYKCFKDGWTSVDNDEHSGWPSTSTTPENIAKVCEAILADCRQTIHYVCEIVGLSYGTAECNLADNLNMKHISARFVPRLLSNNQKALRVSVCRELKQQTRDDPNFISNVIIGDETWVYGYDPETKQQSLQWKLPNSQQLKKACQVHSNVKSMLIIFFDIQGIVHKEFVRPGQTINGKFYCEVLKWLREGIRHKRPEKWMKTIGFSTMTIHPLTHHSLFHNSWLPKTLHWFPTPLFARPCPPATFYNSPRWNYGWKGIVLTRLRKSTQKRKRLSTHSHLRTSTDAWIMGNMLGSLYPCPRGLLWRRRWKLGVMVRNFFLWSNSLNFWVAPCMSHITVTDHYDL